MLLTPLRIWWNRALVCFRILHLLALTTAVTCLYVFTLVYVSPIEQPPISTKTTMEYDDVTSDSVLINLNHFQFLINNPDLCDNVSRDSLYFVVIVHSSPQHFTERMTIRSTWGSVKSFKPKSNQTTRNIRLVFLLGIPQSRLQRQIEEESEIYGDIVQGNFVDSYRNLTYKHMMGYKWLLSTDCSMTRYIVKADDDVFIDLFQLFQLFQKVYDDHPKRVLSCSVHPRGAKPQRAGKWKVTNSEYPMDRYPPYCGGLAYVITPDLARDLLLVSRNVPYFWIDDLYVTGLLAEPLHVRHHYLNLRTTYSTEVLLNWLNEFSYRDNSGSDETACPYIFGNVEGFNKSKLMKLLWKKTLRVWSKTYQISSQL